MRTAWLLVAVALPPMFSGASADDVDARRALVENGLRPRETTEGASFSVEERMAHHRVPGVSLAVLKGYEIDWVAAYGVRDAATGAPVTTETLFQAGSISKPVAAAAALALVDAGKLSLEADIGEFCTSVRLASNDLRTQGPVSLERILAHRAGLTVHGFWGYPNGARIPTAVEVLKGAPPANSDRVTVDLLPGSRFRYAGGGTTLAQQTMVDVTGEAFAPLVHRLVLAPLGMTRSTYAQPLPVDEWPDHTAGHLDDGWPTPARFHVYPEQAAAGLWTTAHDIALFARELGRSYAGDSNAIHSAETSRRMLTAVDGGPTGLGVFVDDKGGEIYFQHGGSNVGFKNQFYVHRERGDGVAIFTNGDGGSALGQEILEAVARIYEWPGFVERPAVARAPADDDGAEAALSVGRYEIEDDLVLRVELHDGELIADFPFAAPQRLVRVGDAKYMAPANGARLRFEEAGDDGYEDAYLNSGGRALYGMRLAADDPLVPFELLLDGRTEDAVAAYRALYEDEPEDPNLELVRLDQFMKGVVARGDFGGRLVLARLAAEFHTDVADAWYELARSAAIAGETAEVRAAVTTAMKLSEGDEDAVDGVETFLAASLAAMLRDAKVD